MDAKSNPVVSPMNGERRILVEGVLKKCGSVWGAWTERYYVLREMDSGYVLSYKIKKTDPQYRNNIIMKNFRLEVDSNEDPLMFTIEIQSQSSQVIVFRAENVRDFTRWTQELLALSQTQRATNDITRQADCAICKTSLRSIDDTFCCGKCMSFVCSNRRCVTVDELWDCAVCTSCDDVPSENVFLLIIERAEGLAAFDMNGLSDPYVAFSYNDETYSTPVQHKTLDPVWNYRFVLPLPKDDTPRALTLRVYDHDMFGYHACMGYVRISIAYLENRRVYASSFQLRTPKDAKRKAKGTLKLRFMKQTTQRLPLDVANRDFYDAAMALRASELVTWVKDIFTFSNPLSSVWWFVAYCFLCLKLPAQMLPMLFPALYLLIALARLLENLCADLALQKQTALRKDAVAVRNAQRRWVQASDARSDESRKASGPVREEVIAKQSPAVSEALKLFEVSPGAGRAISAAPPAHAQDLEQKHPSGPLSPLQQASVVSPGLTLYPASPVMSGDVSKVQPSSLDMLRVLPTLGHDEDPLADILDQPNPKPEVNVVSPLLPAPVGDTDAQPPVSVPVSIRRRSQVWAPEEEKRDIWGKRKCKSKKDRRGSSKGEEEEEEYAENGEKTDNDNNGNLSPFMAGQASAVDAQFGAIDTGDEHEEDDDDPANLMNPPAMVKNSHPEPSSPRLGAATPQLQSDGQAKLQESGRPSKWSFWRLFKGGRKDEDKDHFMHPTNISDTGVGSPKLAGAKLGQGGAPLSRRPPQHANTMPTKSLAARSADRQLAKLYATDDQSISENAERLRKAQSRPKLRRYAYTNVKDLIREIESITEVINWLSDLFFRKLTLVNRDGSPDINFAEERSTYIKTIQICLVYLVILFIVPLRIVLVAWGTFHFTAQLRSQVNPPPFKSKSRLTTKELVQRHGGPQEAIALGDASIKSD